MSADAMLADPIGRALDDLGVTRGRPVVSPATIEHIVRRLAAEAYQAGRHDALMGIVTQRQVAQDLGVEPSTVMRRARRLGLGWQAGSVRLFTRDDIERLRSDRWPRE